MRACRGPNRLMRMFGGQVFRRDLPQNLLADADARCFATATTNAGTGGYGVMACVRVTSLSPLEKDSIRDWCPLARRDYQRRDAVAPICTNFGRITRSKLLNHNMYSTGFGDGGQQVSPAPGSSLAGDELLDQATAMSLESIPDYQQHGR